MVLGTEPGAWECWANSELLSFNITPDNRTSKDNPKESGGEEVEVAGLAAAVMPLLQDGEKRNRKGSRGNREEQMLHGRYPGTVAGHTQQPRENEEVKTGPGETLMADEGDAGSGDRG